MSIVNCIPAAGSKTTADRPLRLSDFHRRDARRRWCQRCRYRPGAEPLAVLRVGTMASRCFPPLTWRRQRFAGQSVRGTLDQRFVIGDPTRMRRRCLQRILRRRSGAGMETGAGVFDFQQPSLRIAFLRRRDLPPTKRDADHGRVLEAVDDQVLRVRRILPASPSTGKGDGPSQRRWSARSSPLAAALHRAGQRVRRR